VPDVLKAISFTLFLRKTIPVDYGLLYRFLWPPQRPAPVPCPLLQPLGPQQFEALGGAATVVSG